jgi:hypothetical protein
MHTNTQYMLDTGPPGPGTSDLEIQIRDSRGREK